MYRVTGEKIHETDLAVLIEQEGVKEWIPFSMCSFISDNDNNTVTYAVNAYHFDRIDLIEDSIEKRTFNGMRSFEAILVHESESAWGVCTNMDCLLSNRNYLGQLRKPEVNVWLPKSKCEIEFISYERHYQVCTFEVPLWLANNKGL